MRLTMETTRLQPPTFSIFSSGIKGDTTNPISPKKNVNIRIILKKNIVVIVLS